MVLKQKHLRNFLNIFHHKSPSPQNHHVGVPDFVWSMSSKMSSLAWQPWWGWLDVKAFDLYVYIVIWYVYIYKKYIWYTSYIYIYICICKSYVYLFWNKDIYVYTSMISDWCMTLWSSKFQVSGQVKTKFHQPGLPQKTSEVSHLSRITLR